jgi:large repetitive protein
MKKAGLFYILILAFALPSFAQNIELAKLQKLLKDQGASWKAEETSISKMPLEERNHFLGGLRPPTGTPSIHRAARNKAAPSDFPIGSAPPPLPSAYSWGNVNGNNWMTSIKNQGSCGSCWAFATCAMFEAGLKIDLNQPTLACDVSEQSFVSCYSNNCDGNSYNNAFTYFKNTGVPDEACFPYSSGSGSWPACSNRCSDWTSRAFFVKDWGFENSPIVDSMKSEILHNGPIGVIISIYTDFDNYGSGVYTHTTGSYRGTHTVVLYGWSNADNCWLAKNSWGTGWGEVGPDNSHGWFRIRMGTNEVGCEDYLYWLDPKLPTPAVPQLVNPSDNALNVTFTPNLIWTKARYASTYQVQLSLSKNFTSKLIDSTLADTAKLVRAGLLSPSSKFFWRVRAKHISDSSAWVMDSFTTTSGVPIAPQLVYPGNNANNIPLTPTLTWYKAASATSYTVQLGTSLSFSLPLIINATPTDTSLAVPSGKLSLSTKYYWKVEAKNSFGTGAPSIDSFTTLPPAPNAPVLYAPLSNSGNISLTPTLIWRKVIGAASYRVQADTLMTFGAGMPVNLSPTDTTVNVATGLVPFKKYYWQVQAINAGGNSAWTIDSFTTVPITPAVPQLVFPGHNAGNISLTPALLWKKSNYATSYHVQLSSSLSFSGILIVNSLLSDTSQLVENDLLTFSTKYFWKVMAKNAGDSSAWIIDSFTTRPPPPAAPILVFPADGAIDVPLYTTLLWNKVPAAVSYNVQVASSSSFGAPLIVNATIPDTARYVGSGLTYSNTYYWRVRTKSAIDSSAWTIRRFTAIPAAPGAPQLVLPANNAVNVPLTPTLTWKKVVAATSYQVLLASSPSYSNPQIIINSSIADTQLAVESGLLGSLTKYYWKVLATNAGGTSLWSADSFTTIPVAPNAPQLVFPGHGATNVSLTPTLLWRTTGPGISYKIQVSSSISFGSTTMIIESEHRDTFESVGSERFTFSSKYYWRVQATNTIGQSAWAIDSFTTVPTVPDAPTLVYPGNNAPNIPLVPALLWNKFNSVDSFHIQLSTISSFLTNIIDEKLVDSFKVVGTGLLSPDVKYFWRVMAINSAGQGPWTTDSFTAVPAIPEAPRLLGPAGNARNIPVVPLFQWNKAVSATIYNLQLASSANFDQALLDSTLADSAMLPATLSLSRESKFFWRVRAKNSGGWSGWSTDSFYTIPEAPGAPNLSFPIDSQTNLPISPRLSWFRAASAVSYFLQLAIDPSFASIVKQDSALSDTVFTCPLDNSTKYFWRVAAANTGGSGQWSPTRTFCTIVPLPSIVMPKMPACDTIKSDSVILSWAASTPQVDAYRVEYASDSVFTKSTIDSAVNDTFSIVRKLRNNSSLWWRIQAHNAAGWSDYSEVRKISVRIPSTAVLPASYSLNVNSLSATRSLIRYGLPTASLVSFKLFNMQGKVVRVFINAHQSAGYYQIPVSLSGLSRGCYLIHFKAGNFQIRKKFSIY